MALVYTNIQHEFRKQNKLSCNEYVLADMIYALSTRSTAKITGWCWMSRNEMADEVGVSKQTILNLIQSLIDKGFVEKDPVTTFLRCSDRWEKVYFTDGKESLPEMPVFGKKSLPKAGTKSLPNNYNIDNDKKNNNIAIPLFFDEELQTTFNHWLEMRKKKGKGATEHAQNLALKKIERLSNSNKQMALAIMEKSILSSYTDFYPLKDFVEQSPAEQTQMVY